MIFDQPTEYYNVGTIRLRRKFVFRKVINGEVRYFQIATWKEEYVHVFVASFDNYCEWRSVCWLSQEEFEKFNTNPNNIPSVGWN